MMQMTLSELAAATGHQLKWGDIVIFATSPDRLKFLGQAIEHLGPTLKANNITAIIMSDDMGMTIVPEARRLIPLPVDKR